jgi:phage shock protein E
MRIQDLLKQPAKTIIDVRETWEFEEAHFPGAVNIPLSNIPLKLAELREMQSPLVLYCRSGNRSGMAATMLRTAGFEQVHNGGALSEIMANAKKNA